MKSGFYRTTGDDQLRDGTEQQLQSTSQSQTCTRKGHGHRSLACSRSDPRSFLGSGETTASEQYAQHSREMPANCTARARPRSTARARSSPRRCRPHVAQPTLRKLSRPGCKALPDGHAGLTSPQRSAGKTPPRPAGAQQAFQEVVASQRTDCHAPASTGLFLIDKNVWIVMLPILIDKHV